MRPVRYSYVRVQLCGSPQHRSFILLACTCSSRCEVDTTNYDNQSNERFFNLGTFIFFQGTCIRRPRLIAWHWNSNFLCGHVCVRCKVFIEAILVRDFVKEWKMKLFQTWTIFCEFSLCKSHNQRPSRGTRDAGLEDSQLH